MRVIVRVLVVSGCWSASVAGQPPSVSDAIPGVEVASVRVAEGAGRRGGSISFLPNGRVVVTSLTLRLIIQNAYDIDPRDARFRIQGGPENVMETRFDVTVIPVAGDRAQGPEEARRMLQAVLAARFKLRLQTADRPMPVYLLTRRPTDSRRGLKRSTHDCGAILAAIRDNRKIEEPRDTGGVPVCTRSLEAKGGAFIIRGAGPVDALVNQLKSYVDRPLVDETELAGRFEWTIGPFAIDAFSQDPPSISYGLGAAARHSSRACGARATRNACRIS